MEPEICYITLGMDGWTAILHHLSLRDCFHIGQTCRMLHSIVHDVHFLSQRLSLCGIPRSETRDCYLMYLESTACDNVLLGKIVCSNAELSCLPEFRVDFLNLDYASQVKLQCVQYISHVGRAFLIGLESMILLAKDVGKIQDDEALRGNLSVGLGLGLGLPEDAEVEMISCEDDSEILTRLNEIVRESNPRFICGFQIKRHDLPYLQRKQREGFELPWLKKTYIIDLRDLYCNDFSGTDGMWKRASYLASFNELVRRHLGKICPARWYYMVIYFRLLYLFKLDEQRFLLRAMIVSRADQPVTTSMKLPISKGASQI